MAKFQCNVISYTLKRTVDITVVIPTPTIPESMGMGGKQPSHTPKADYPVLYLLHGMGNNHATWSGYSNVEFFAEERNIAVVMISGENKGYINHENGDSFYDFVAEEVPEFVKAMFPVSGRPEDTYIAGLSMGGYGTLVHAFSHPERFAAYGSFSGAPSLSGPDGPADIRFRPLDMAKELYAKGGKLPKGYIACGENDFLYEKNVEFKEELAKLGADFTWVSVPDYTHEWRFWNLQIEAFLDWIPRTDDYAKAGKRQI